jgi:chromosome segregation protein
MGENSYKNMRASGMDDVIFPAASTVRPATRPKSRCSWKTRSARRPPPSTTPTIWRSAAGSSAKQGSNYKINAKDVRARDVQLLFADASTGARSPAMVRQGRSAS